MPLDFSKLTPGHLHKLLPSQTVFLFPVGPLEDHGSHLPLGMDLEEARWISRNLGGRIENELSGWTAILMPAVPLGIESNTSRIALTVRPHVLRDWLVDACRSLMKAGFLHFVCLSGHLGPRQLTAIEEAGRMIAHHGRLSGLWRAGRRATLVSASSALVSAKEVFRAPLWPDVFEHGGQRDTSVALAVCDSASISVDPVFRALQERNLSKSFWRRSFQRFRKRTCGYWGKPADATVEQGRAELERILEQVFPKLRATWEGANPNLLFRSWYSVLPPNKSFFRAWVLFFFITAILMAWVYLSVRTLYV